MDLEGRSDEKGLKRVLKTVQPKKLILMSGGQDAKVSIRDYVLGEKIAEDVQLPSSNQFLEITSDSALYRLTLHESLLHNIQFTRVNDEWEVGYAEGEMKVDYLESTLPILKQVDEHHRQGHDAVFLGSYDINAIMKILAENGIQAEVYNRLIVCSDGAVQIQKQSGTKIAITGALCEDYFKIRELLYQQYQIV